MPDSAACRAKPFRKIRRSNDFKGQTLYGLDDEMDEYGDTGAYGESPEEILEEEEEEEEEEAGVPVISESVVEVEEVIPVLRNPRAAVAPGNHQLRRRRPRRNPPRKRRRRLPKEARKKETRQKEGSREEARQESGQEKSALKKKRR